MSRTRTSDLRSSATLETRKSHSSTLRQRLQGYTRRTLGAGGSLNEAVKLPKGESCAAWVAVNAIEFYEVVSTLWAVLKDDPFLATYKAGEGFPSGVEYVWVDDQTGRKTYVSGPEYINLVLSWIVDQINDGDKFPYDEDDEEDALRIFQTREFAMLCGQIYRRLFRVYAIIYSCCFGALESLGMAPHLNSSFKHFMFFCLEFRILPEREIEPIDALVKPIRHQYWSNRGQ